MAIYLSHEDVRNVIRMEDIFQAVEQAFRDYGLELATNLYRQRLRVPRGVYRVMSGAVPSLGGMGSKVGLHGFDVPAGVNKSHDLSVLYSSETGEVQAVILSNLITDYRTGAISAVSVKYLARPDAGVVGILGTGRQARTQLPAVALVRSIEKVLVYSPTAEHRQVFADEMSKELGIEVVAKESAREVVEAAEILVIATNSSDPVLNGEWLQEGAHVVSIKSSHKVDIGLGQLRLGDVDHRTVARSNVVAVDSLEQAQVQESPDLEIPMSEGRVLELGALVSGRAQGRIGPGQITLCKAYGMGMTDVAAAAKVYQLAKARGLGLKLPES